MSAVSNEAQSDDDIEDDEDDIFEPAKTQQSDRSTRR